MAANMRRHLGMSKPLQILFMIFAGIATLYLVITIGYNLLSEGQSMASILSMENWLPGSG